MPTNRSTLIALAIWLASLAGLGLAGCLATGAPFQPASQAEIEERQRTAMTQSMGHPTKKSPEELERVIAQQTTGWKPEGRKLAGRLEAPSPLVFEGVRGTCYTFIIRLDQGAVWARGAEAGLRFDFQTPSGQGSGGPGLVGPGAVASVGCAEASGTITLAMAPMVGREPIGQGSYTAELWTHVLSAEEEARLAADKQRQIDEQRAFAEREAAQKQQREGMGCAKCDGRYQGCIGAGRKRDVCQSDYRSCAFREVGVSYTSACPYPNR